MPEARVFIIHSEEDDKILRKLVREYNGQIFGETTLQTRFVDSKNAEQMGKDFGAFIKQEINDSHFVIVIVTPNSADSVWVNQEIGYAEGKGRDILPVKQRAMAREGLGFIHSNIDAQLFHDRQRRFRKLDEFFVKKFGEKASKVVGGPLVFKATRESAKTAIRRVEPYVV